MPKLVDVLDKEFLRQLETFSIRMETLLLNGYSGVRSSKARGMSLEFSDFRPYTLGDDIRRIDWNSYGRFDKLFLKLFMEEKQGTINIFLDSSTSMDSGKVNKLFYAKQLAAALSYIALKNTDIVNLFSCGKIINKEKRNIQTKNIYLDLVTFLDELPVDNGTKLVTSIMNIKNRSITKGISFIISDFFSEDGYEEAVKILQYKRQQVVLVHILSPEEINPNLRGNFRLIDKENRSSKSVEITEDKIKHYKRVLEDFKNKIQSFATQRGVGYVFLSTDMPILRGLKDCLEE